MHLVVLAAVLISWSPAPPRTVWSGLGHRLIARVAAERISAPVRAEVETLLGGLALRDVAVWADSIRPARPETAPFHYINVPVDSPFTEWRRYCPATGCILEALERYRALLADRAKPLADRAEALKWVVHLVGDLHQPLHVGEREDRGGNDMPVLWQGFRTNLHSVWDGRILGSAGLDEEAYWARLREHLVSAEFSWSAGGPVDWAAESHAMSRDHVYRVPGDLDVSSGYARENLARAERRVLQAGLRLGRMLEDALGDR
jgi:nuclease S1